jgi:hypothetical protein
VSLFSVFVHYSGTEVYFVEAEDEKAAHAKALKRWDDGDDGDSPGTQKIGIVEVEKEKK